MSYPVGLDDYDDDRLVGELARRMWARVGGKCSYCGAWQSGERCGSSQHHGTVERIHKLLADAGITSQEPK